jgi:hypothetical protein
MEKRILYGFLILFAIGLGGCDIINPEESLPAYLRLGRSTVLVDPAQPLVSDLGIRDLWIFRGQEFLGVYQIGAVIPFFPTQATEFVIEGGVFETGLSASRVRYPFWQPITLQVPTGALDTFTLTPTFQYYPDSLLAYPFVEDFESVGSNFVELVTGANAATLDITNADAFEGSRSGEIVFGPDFSQYEGASAGFFSLPQRGNNDVWVELTYKNNVPFTVGLYYVTNTDAGDLGDGIFFNSNMEWNTVYVHVNDFVRSVPETAVFRLYIRANSNGASGKLLLDQVRVIYFR